MEKIVVHLVRRHRPGSIVIEGAGVADPLHDPSQLGRAYLVGSGQIGLHFSVVGGFRSVPGIEVKFPLPGHQPVTVPYDLL